MSADATTLVLHAVLTAARWHSPQRRKGSAAEPYINHLIEVAALVSDAVSKGHVPLTLGGDHSIAIGTLGGMALARGPGAALWIDAHGDLNRPATSPTGNVHGMPLAAALGVAGPEFETDAFPVPSVTR